jgi:2-keto-4-pentenoate hydratase/2-oxohepta-3-ene-1,7-dioic acid hydratase in catechol pathway
MRFASIRVAGSPRVVAISDDGTRYTDAIDAGAAFGADMNAWIERNTAQTDRPTAAKPNGNANWQPLDGVKLLAPLMPRRNVFCVGKNYHEHAKEFGDSGFDTSAKDGEAAPPFPVVFTKAPSTVIADGEPVQAHRNVTSQLDYEAELAVVIGKGGKDIAKEHAWEHVYGYTIVNDVTARDLQQRHRQWFLGKSIDTFCPMGPWIVTADEIDATRLKIQCRINGELRQDANTADLIFDIPTLIETLSAVIALQPGDVIATGTPAGVGIGFKPPKFLQPGDEMSVSIEGIGTLTNKIQ